MIRAAIISLVLASPALANEMRPAPRYFVEGYTAAGMAEMLATGCPSVAVNIDAFSRHMTALQGRLARDGFDTAALSDEETFAEFYDSSFDEFESSERAFYDKYPNLGQGREAFCAAARAEVSSQTLIGSLLMGAR